jgi:hypothetical protein
MNTYQIHTQLVFAIQSASRLREELKSNRLWHLGRVFRRLRHAYLLLYVESLTRRLHSRTAA